jgi:hypothetical protein
MSSQPGQNVDFILTAKAQQDHVVKLYNEIQTSIRAANVCLDFFRSTKEREEGGDRRLAPARPCKDANQYPIAASPGIQ